MTVLQTAQQCAPVNPLIPFDFEDNPVRVILDEHGAPWFHAGDVCRVLEYANPRDAIALHVDTEDVGKRDTLTQGGVQQANYINESGLYALIFGSIKPEAKRFKRWVTQEVLPAIRKTGGFGIEQEIQKALGDMAEQIKRLTADMRKPAPKTPPPSRAELKARYNSSGAMDYRQAIHPIHLEYGQPWTTSMAICQACDLNHDVLAGKIDELVRNGAFSTAEYSRLSMTPGHQFGWLIHGFRLSESGCKKVVAFLDALDINAQCRANIHSGTKTLMEAFAEINHKPTRGRPPRDADAFADAMANLGSALTKMSSTIHIQGGSKNG